MKLSRIQSFSNLSDIICPVAFVGIGLYLGRFLFDIPAEIAGIHPLLFFIAGPCNDGCATDGGSGGSSGGSGGSSGGSDPAGSDTGESSATSCGTCASSDSCTTTSTPYLSLLTKSGFKILNDVMIGSPPSYVQSKEEGMMRMQSGMVGSDIYPFSLSNADKDASQQIQLRLREIEPEETFIYAIKFHTYSLKQDEQIIQTWDHQKLFSYRYQDAHAIDRISYNGKTNCLEDPQKSAGGPSREQVPRAVQLEAGDFVTFRVPRGDAAETHIIVSSFWRDWGPGTAQVQQDDVQTPHRKAPRAILHHLHSAFTKAAILAGVVMAAFGVSTSSHNTNGTPPSNDDLLHLLKKHNAPKSAFADTPHGGGNASLIVSFKHPAHGLWVHVGTIQPRAHKPSDVMVAIPSDAYNEQGIAMMRIEATKRHYLTGIQTVSTIRPLTPEQSMSVALEHIRNGETIAAYRSTNFPAPLHLIAGDTLTLRSGSVSAQATHGALELHGFYMPLTEHGRRIAGKWHTTLSAEEESVLETIYGSIPS